MQNEREEDLVNEQLPSRIAAALEKEHELSYKRNRRELLSRLSI